MLFQNCVTGLAHQRLNEVQRTDRTLEARQMPTHAPDKFSINFRLDPPTG
jgi:hypothetical protein